MQNLWVLANAANLSETNPAASQLLFDLDNAETGSEVQEALNNYDEAVNS